MYRPPPPLDCPEVISKGNLCYICSDFSRVFSCILGKVVVVACFGPCKFELPPIFSRLCHKLFHYSEILPNEELRCLYQAKGVQRCSTPFYYGPYMPNPPLLGRRRTDHSPFFLLLPWLILWILRGKIHFYIVYGFWHVHFSSVTK